jgi:hypothetical protein
MAIQVRLARNMPALRLQDAATQIMEAAQLVRHLHVCVVLGDEPHTRYKTTVDLRPRIKGA